MAGCTGKTEQPAKAEATEKAAPAKDSTPADEEITLTFWHTYGDAEEAQFKDVVLPLWEKAHPNIKIDAVRQDGGQFHEMIVTSFGTGMSPDVARVDIANIAAYAKQGGLVALSDYADFAEISGNYLDAPLSTNLYQGKYYGLPLDTNCKAAVVNKNVLKEIGLDDVPETMEAFIEAAKESRHLQSERFRRGRLGYVPLLLAVWRHADRRRLYEGDRLSGQRCQHRRHEQADRAARPEDLHHP